MFKSWEFLEDCGRLLTTTLRRDILTDVESGRLATLVEAARDILLRSYRDIGFKDVYVSFNGGKESITAFHLHRLATRYQFGNSGSTDQLPMNVIYFKDDGVQDFPEITSFMNATAEKYNFVLRIVEGNWRNGIPQLPESHHKGFIIGSRSSDFDSPKLSAIQKGDLDNICFTRIHPLVDWTYGDVWNFIKLFSLDYCKLYDRGYTSVGSVGDTIANPHLRRADGSYAPACTLKDWSLERCGRSRMI